MRHPATYRRRAGTPVTRAAERAGAASVNAHLYDAVTLLNSPINFAAGACGFKAWAKQRQIMESVVKYERTGVKACHSSGKTAVAAQIALWWLAKYSDGIVITTAPTWTQVEKLLWGEIHAALAVCKIAFPEATQTELKLGPRNYLMGLSTNDAVRFQGWHGGHILVILDEAPGVLPGIWEAIEGIRAGGQVHVLALGNPIIASGPFHTAFTTNAEGWSLFTISAFDTPNLVDCCITTADGSYHVGRRGGLNLLTATPEQLATNVAPYLTTRGWVREKFHEWGPDHPLWDSKVLGNFPGQADNALVPSAWMDRAVDDDLRAIPPGAPFDAGIDVAGPGEDSTVLTVRCGAQVVLQRSWADVDPRRKCAAALSTFRSRLRHVNVDAVGQGYYFARFLEDRGYPVIDVNVGSTHHARPTGQRAEIEIDTESFPNLKALISWSLRERFMTGDIHGIKDVKTRAQGTTITYKHDARGRIKIESKEELTKRGVSSPDEFESLMLAFYEPVLPRRPVVAGSTTHVTR